jgi:hypothetical protein
MIAKRRGGNGPVSAGRAGVHRSAQKPSPNACRPRDAMIDMPNVPASRARVPWGTVRIRETLAIRAAPQELAALYLDYPNWSRLFPATIRGVRWIGDDGRDITVEVDHRAEGRVANIIRPISPTVIALDEFKPRFDATFVNRFEAAGDATRYVLDAEIRFRMPFALIAPLVRWIVRRRMRRFVLEPMRDAAEPERPRRKSRPRQAQARPERPRLRRR